MGRALEPKCKQCRREGKKLFLKGERCDSSKCALVKRNYIPGIHGPKLTRGPRLTGYGTQLRAKQAAKKTYRILEKQFKLYFTKAINQKGETGDNLFRLLELRLDNVVYRSNLVSSRDIARQIVNHGHILVNGKKVSIPSYQVKLNDVITLKEKIKKSELFKDVVEKIKNKECPDWINVDLKDLSVRVVEIPELSKNQPDYDLKLIIEFYSK